MIKRLLLLLFVLTTQFTFSQVGINTVNPNVLTVLDVTLTLNGTDTVPKGIMVPRMTETQRDQINTSDADLANSLLVYNTTEDCFNYFSKTDNVWVSLCGTQTKDAIFTVDCGQVSVKGSYTINTALNSSNYIEMTVVVTQAGSYNISAITVSGNGYYFSLIGEFVQPGTYILQIPGFGTPTTYNSSGDKLLLRNNNLLICDNLTIILGQAEYSIDCSSIEINGDYIATIPLTSENTITAKVTADAELIGYNYTIKTDIINGYSFNGSGTLIEGEQTITITGSGTPLTNGTNAFVLKNNSMKEGIPSCNATVTVAARPVRIQTVSTSSIAYNIGSSSNYANRALMNSDYFSLNSGATYSTSGFVFNSITANGRLEAAITSFSPDIIIAQYAFVPSSSSEITAITNFVNKGGVFIYCTDYSTNTNIISLIQSIFDGDTNIQLASSDNNDVVTLLDSGTSITSGPFMNLSSLGMARDANGNFGLVTSTMPTNDYVPIAYSNGGASVRMLVHKTKGFVFIGDGGPFGSSLTVTTGAAYSSPAKFALDSAGNMTAVSTPSSPVSYNSFLFLNTIAWAIDYLKTNGGIYP